MDVMDVLVKLEIVNPPTYYSYFIKIKNFPEELLEKIRYKYGVYENTINRFRINVTKYRKNLWLGEMFFDVLNIKDNEEIKELRKKCEKNDALLFARIKFFKKIDRRLWELRTFKEEKINLTIDFSEIEHYFIAEFI